ncbi:MAG TPA: translation initiation factor IF-3 [Candidatus Dependentiae bacterium]|nr:translation initiation factor IF-3 [Candidatus Dependentiae bacterium]HRQ62483.1 translation initiation factor IF-3 [Candidatus Dependentiae bacterium]
MDTLKELKDKREKSPLINEKIRADRFQLIGSSGENIGVVSRSQALQQADEEGLDLVLIAESGKDGLPVAKIMDFGKVLYEKKKKKAEAKKHQKVIQVKEVKISPKIGEHDYQTKMKQAIQFLEDGKRVKFTLFFRGREQATKDERGDELFAKIEKTFRDNGFTSDNMLQESDMKAGRLWSRIYYLKGN